MKPRPTPMKVIAFEYLKGMSERDPQSKEYHAFADHLGVNRDYWAALDLPFRTFLHDLAKALTQDAFGNEIVGDTVQLHWLAAATSACKIAFRIALDSLGNSPRALRARALAEVSLAISLKLARETYLATLEGAEA